MATDKQKEELMNVLKFTPVTYRISVYGYGGESYAGTVDRKIYEYFKEHKIDIDNYVNDWDSDIEVPEEFRPFEPGEQYECDNLYHCSGATMDGSSYLVVYDENNNEVFETTLDLDDLDNRGVDVYSGREVYLNELEEGTVCFVGGNGEKGTFFGTDLVLTQPFDPKKLVVSYEDCDGWFLMSGVSYDNEDLEDDDYSTTGKWSEHKWVIVGDEEVFDPSEE